MTLRVNRVISGAGSDVSFSPKSDQTAALRRLSALCGTSQTLDLRRGSLPYITAGTIRGGSNNNQHP